MHYNNSLPLGYNSLPFGYNKPLPLECNNNFNLWDYKYAFDSWQKRNIGEYITHRVKHMVDDVKP